MNVPQTCFLLGLLAAGGNTLNRAPHRAPVHVTTQIGTNHVSITISGGAVIQANGLPDHTPGRFPRPGNPNSIAAQDYHFQVPLNPKVAAATASSARWWFGVAVNGVRARHRRILEQ